MKKYMLLGLLVAVLTVPTPARCQAKEIAQLALNIEKLNQFRQILQQLYDAYKIISDGYNKIKNIAEGNYKIHEVFLDGLYLVNPNVKKYHRVADIIAGQIAMVKEYKAAYKSLSASEVFTKGELDYLSDVYKRLIDDSIQNLDELTMILTSKQLRASDDERLAGIDRIYEDVQQKLMFLRTFNRQHAMIAVQKMREKTEIGNIQDLNGLENQ
ncbi:MAG: TerB family tellurite resistance protein [Chitinophagaceae bacterium]|nr:TerB family tellurite resistance protein [Chitinophagaceae bacterium]